MIVLLNSPVLTNYGLYEYEELTLKQAKELVKEGFVSAIGHESTAQVLTTLLGVDVLANRIVYSQGVGEEAIIFKLSGRPPEGRVLSVEEIEDIGYHFGLLKRLR